MAHLVIAHSIPPMNLHWALDPPNAYRSDQEAAIALCAWTKIYVFDAGLPCTHWVQGRPALSRSQKLLLQRAKIQSGRYQ